MRAMSLERGSELSGSSTAGWVDRVRAMLTVLLRSAVGEPTASTGDHALCVAKCRVTAARDDLYLFVTLPLGVHGLQRCRAHPGASRKSQGATLIALWSAPASLTLVSRRLYIKWCRLVALGSRCLHAALEGAAVHCTWVRSERESHDE